MFEPITSRWSYTFYFICVFCNCRFYCQQPASSSWWMCVRFVVSSCSLSFTPPTAWASEPSLTCTHAHSFSTRPTHSPVSFPAFAPQTVSHLSQCVRVHSVVGDSTFTVSPALKNVSWWLSVSLCLSEQHFTEVVQGEEFLGLSLQQVCSLIASDKLTVSTEEKVRWHNVHAHFCTLTKAVCLFPHGWKKKLCPCGIFQVIMAERERNIKTLAGKYPHPH